MRFFPRHFALRSQSSGIFAAGTRVVGHAGEWMTLAAPNWTVLEFAGATAEF